MQGTFDYFSKIDAGGSLQCEIRYIHLQYFASSGHLRVRGYQHDLFSKGPTRSKVQKLLSNEGKFLTRKVLTVQW
jgi:hypothetical protein